MDENAFSRARGFMLANSRLLEQRAFAALFEGAPNQGVVDALRSYQNDDGGFGHGLEPDKRCPFSLPIDVEIALDAFAAAGTVDQSMVTRACDFLASVATPDGAVPLGFASIEDYPHAAHWADWAYQPGLNPTAGLVGRLHGLGVEHAWMAAAAAWCWRTLEQRIPDEAHELGEVLVFLDHSPDRARADATAALVREALAEARWFRLDPTDPEYGVTPLHVAPRPDSRWRPLFADTIVEGHLQRLERDQ